MNTFSLYDRKPLQHWTAADILWGARYGLIASGILLIVFCLGARKIFASEAPKPKPVETLSFKPKLPKKPIGVGFLMKTWHWPGEPAYKQERINFYADLLRERGIEEEDIKMLVANLIVESGAMNEKAIGDSGCSVGIPQRNVCQFGYTAKAFVKKYPVWNDWRHQLTWMADHTAASYKKFKGDVFRTVVYHNSPRAALKNVDACHISPCYYQRVKNASAKLTTAL